MTSAVTHCSCGVLVREGRFLLGRRSSSARSHHGKWDVIGGHREAGETDEQTMIRELHEELGIVPTVWKHEGARSETVDATRFLLQVFSVQNWEGAPTNCSDEHDELAWFLPSELVTLDLSSRALLDILLRIAS